MSQNYKIVERLRGESDFLVETMPMSEVAKTGRKHPSASIEQAASLIQELGEAAERLATHLDERIDSAPRDAVPVFSGLAELRSILSKLKEA